MIAQFKVGNYLSFKEEVTFSMVGGAPVKEHERGGDLCNIFNDPSGKNKLLKSAAVFGANNSGKSNLFKAMAFFRDFILTSFTGKYGTDEIEAAWFLFSTETDGAPSSFEMIFFIGDDRYRYGFEADREKVCAEWLWSLKSEPSAKETKLFIREYQEVKPNRQFFKEGKGLEDKTRANALFLSTCAQFNGALSGQIASYFKNNFVILTEVESQRPTSAANAKFQKDALFKKTVVEFFKSIHIGFEDMEAGQNPETPPMAARYNLPSMVAEEQAVYYTKSRNALKMTGKMNEDLENFRENTIFTVHKKFDQAGSFANSETMNFALASKGVVKLFNLLSVIFDALQHGKILIVDDLDAYIHPLTTAALVKFFHLAGNKQAQLIFSAKDASLLKKEIFRRDQIWFTEKDGSGATDLYSLVEYKINQASVRNDASFQKDYLLGKYGALPETGDLLKFGSELYYEFQKQKNEQI